MKILLSIIAVLFAVLPAGAQTIYFAGEPKTIAWDAPPWDAQYDRTCDGVTTGRYFAYDVVLARNVTGEAFNYSTRELTLQVQPTILGTYSVKVRSKLMNSDGSRVWQCGTNQVPIPESAWCEANSMCGQLMNGQNGPWQIRYTPKVPDGLDLKGGSS